MIPFISSANLSPQYEVKIMIDFKRNDKGIGYFILDTMSLIKYYGL